MKEYVKPIVLANDELNEGVYAAGSGCFDVTSWIENTPENGRGYYVIKTRAKHNATDGHHSSEQYLTVKFNQVVTDWMTYVPQFVEYVSGKGTDTIVVKYIYHQNAGDNIEYADFNVWSEPGLAIKSASLTCNETCSCFG